MSRRNACREVEALSASSCVDAQIRIDRGLVDNLILIVDLVDVSSIVLRQERPERPGALGFRYGRSRRCPGRDGVRGGSTRHEQRGQPLLYAICPITVGVLLEVTLVLGFGMGDLAVSLPGEREIFLC